MSLFLKKRKKEKKAYNVVIRGIFHLWKNRLAYVRCGSYLFGQILINTLGAWVSDYQVQDILKVINLTPNENLILNTVNLSYFFFVFFSQIRLSFYLNNSPFPIFFPN